MARKRTEYGSAVEARIEALMLSGGTAESIAATLTAEGTEVSRATIGRRMRELQGRVDATRAKEWPPLAPPSEPSSSEPPSDAEADVVPDVPESVPEGTPLEMVDRWVSRIERAASKAEADGNLGAVAALAAKMVTLLEHRRKATPPARIDPNDNPDMVKLGAEVAERLHKAVDIVARWR